MTPPADNRIAVEEIEALLQELEVTELVDASHVSFLVNSLISDRGADEPQVAELEAIPGKIAQINVM